MKKLPFLFVLFLFACGGSDEPAEKVTVTFLNKKPFEGKTRYFFTLNNAGSEAFAGRVRFTLLSTTGESFGDRDVIPDNSLAAGGTGVMYFDSSVDPAIMGEIKAVALKTKY